MTDLVLVAWGGLWLIAVGGLMSSFQFRSSAVAATRLIGAGGSGGEGQGGGGQGGGGQDGAALAKRPGGVRRSVSAGWAQGSEFVGRLLRRLARRPADALLDRRLGAAVLAALSAAPIDVRLAAIVALLAWMRPIRAKRRERQKRHAAVVQELPEVVDLLSVAVRGGLTVPLAVAAVGERLDGEVAAALQHCVDEAALGQRLSDRLEFVPDRLGDATRPLVRALIAADRYGVPVGEPLERVAADVRTARRRNAEIAARRVPIKLLFPLVFCVLPSFALLTVAPVLASSLESLRL